MAVRRLINVIEALAIGKNPQSIRGGQQFGVQNAQQNAVFLVRARVESAGQSSVVISTQEGSSTASLATDEPLRAGQTVWACKTDDGAWLVLGSIG